MNTCTSHLGIETDGRKAVGDCCKEKVPRMTRLTLRVTPFILLYTLKMRQNKSTETRFTELGSTYTRETLYGYFLNVLKGLYCSDLLYLSCTVVKY